MSQSKVDRETIRAAADAVVEFASTALRAEYLRWDKNVNLGMAEFIWNVRGRGLSMGAPPGHDAAFGQMCEVLMEMRRTRWPDEDFMVMGLDAIRRGDEIVFGFELTWDDFQTRHPCEIVWDPKWISPALLN